MRQPLYNRLRPFLRRDVRARLVSALLSVAVLTGLTWLGVSALSGIDSREAHELRIELGMESPTAVCGSTSYMSRCNYDDHAQEAVDREFHRRRELRRAVLSDLDRRLQMALEQLGDAKRILDEMVVDPRTGEVQGDTVALRDALSEAVIDIAPAEAEPVEIRRERLLGTFERLGPAAHAPSMQGLKALVNGRDVAVDTKPSRPASPNALRPDALRPDALGWIDAEPDAEHRFRVRRLDMKAELLAAVGSEYASLRDTQRHVERLLRRDGVQDRELGDQTSRITLIEELTPRGDENYDEFMRRLELAGWFAVRAHVDWLDDEAAYDRNAAIMTNAAAVLVADAMHDVEADLARLARTDAEALHEAITEPAADIWEGGWTNDEVARQAIIKPMVRYRSPVDAAARWRLFGVVTFLLGGVMLLVVGPVVTATSTAREREAGTLPVLRMTGLSAGDLAMAMAIGPNVFALVAGGGLLALSLPILALTAGPVALLLPLGLLLVLAAATHLTAIGLGDALGQRVNAMVVGGLLGLGLLAPGLVGAVMVVGDMAATGLLLGPLPAVIGEAVGLSGLPFARVTELSEMGVTMLGYSVAMQALLGGLCLLSWRRRVEQAWAPLFRPYEGALLALASVGCSALTVLDLSQRIHVQTYDAVNLITFVSSAFLMPVLGWLLVSSLVRPARASAVASCTEVRRAFVRFQLFVVLTAAALAGAYLLVLDSTALRAEKSEVMLATLTQALLVAETVVATLLLASRRREGKHRVFILGATIALLQLAFAVGVYRLEVEHVAFTQQTGMPFMIGMHASPYWIAFLVVLWAAGLGLVLAALLRERGKERPLSAPTASEPEAGHDKGNRWLH